MDDPRTVDSDGAITPTPSSPPHYCPEGQTELDRLVIVVTIVSVAVLALSIALLIRYRKASVLASRAPLLVAKSTIGGAAWTIFVLLMDDHVQDPEFYGGACTAFGLWLPWLAGCAPWNAFFVQRLCVMDKANYGERSYHSWLPLTPFVLMGVMCVIVIIGEGIHHVECPGLGEFCYTDITFRGMVLGFLAFEAILCATYLWKLRALKSYFNNFKVLFGGIIVLVIVLIEQAALIGSHSKHTATGRLMFTLGAVFAVHLILWCQVGGPMLAIVRALMMGRKIASIQSDRPSDYGFADSGSFILGGERSQVVQYNALMQDDAGRDLYFTYVEGKQPMLGACFRALHDFEQNPSIRQADYITRTYLDNPNVLVAVARRSVPTCCCGGAAPKLPTQSASTSRRRGSVVALDIDLGGIAAASKLLQSNGIAKDDPGYFTTVMTLIVSACRSNFWSTFINDCKSDLTRINNESKMQQQGLAELELIPSVRGSRARSHSESFDDGGDDDASDFGAGAAASSRRVLLKPMMV
jgi:hypothetical protein